MDIGNNIDSQQLSQAFSFSKEKSRALHGLRGILSGLVADKRLNEKEFLYLDAWLKSQQYLADDNNVVSLLSKVGDILEDGEVSKDELIELENYIEQILAHKDSGESDRIAKIAELSGFLTGVASDGVLNDKEIEALSHWLDANAIIRDVWPASVIVDRLLNILEDGLITDEERQDLLETIRRVTGADKELADIGFEESTEVWEDIIDSLEFENTCFCLTGDFVIGARSGVDELLRFRASQTSPNVNANVDYLVIGTLASRDWLYTSHGRKIEKALLLKREGNPIKIITERSLLKFLRSD